MLALRALPYRSARDLFGMKSDGRRDPDRLARAVRRADRLVPGTKCLARAMAWMAMARLTGAQGELMMGAMISEKGFEAHAWIRSGDRVVLGDLPNLAEMKVFSERP